MNSPSSHHLHYQRTSAAPGPFRGGLHETLRGICRTYLKLGGWRLEGDWPGHKKCVLLAAPHTANIDGFNMLATAAHFRVNLKWMGKKSLTTGPLGGLVKWAGCVPVDRAAAHDVVEQMGRAFDNADELVLAVAPEGTRARNPEWKTGFYRIAQRANVPIVMSVLDYGTKTIRLSGEIRPTGDLEADMALIKSHYATATGKVADQFTLGD